MVKLPFIPPSETQNTDRKPGANTSYGDIIHFGQSLLSDDVKNVSVLSRFTHGDTPKAGMRVIVSVHTGEGARTAAKAVSTRAWAYRARYVPSSRRSNTQPTWHSMCAPRVAIGVDINAQRSLIIKSRGHFRAWAGEFFTDERIIEVEVPGLTTPVLKNVPYEHIPRPLRSLDDDWGWQVGEPEMFAAR